MPFENYSNKKFSLIFLFFIIVVIDQISKFVARKYLFGETFFVASEFFVLKFYQNYQTILGVNLFFLIVYFLILCFILFYIAYRKKLNFYPAIHLRYLIFIVAGAAGNIIDRIRFGFVIDFISVSFFSNELIFNLADCAILLGTILIMRIILSKRKVIF